MTASKRTCLLKQFAWPVCMSEMETVQERRQKRRQKRRLRRAVWVRRLSIRTDDNAERWLGQRRPLPLTSVISSASDNSQPPNCSTYSSTATTMIITSNESNLVIGGIAEWCCHPKQHGKDAIYQSIQGKKHSRYQKQNDLIRTLYSRNKANMLQGYFAEN